MPLTALSAVAVCRAVQRVTGVRPQIKWPNDLVLGGRKLAGILTEMSLEGESGHVSHVVVGIGINVHQQPEDFAGEVADIARTVRLLRGDTRETVQALRIDERYGLVVRHEDGTEETVRSGEVSVRGLYGYTE